MWRETNLFGIYFSPLLAYMLVTGLVYAPIRVALIRLRLFRWTWNPPLVEVGLFVCILGLLVDLL